MVSAAVIKKITNDPTSYANSLDIDKLVKLLNELADSYYNSGKQLISDELFDMLKDNLRKRDPDNAYHKIVGAVVKGKVKLPAFMGSLDKIKPDTDALAKFKQKYPGPYVTSDKLDGNSALLYKKDAKTYKMYSRGDGHEGQDISHLIDFVVNHEFARAKVPIGTMIRGELIISRKNFDKIAHRMANARNAVAGMINSKTTDSEWAEVANMTEFVAYSIIEPRMTMIDQIAKLESYNINIVEYKILEPQELTNDKLNDYLVTRRKNSRYDIDGIVVFDSNRVYDHTQENPDYGFAFKTVLDDQVAEAVIEDVLWQASKDGYLKPRIQIAPIKLVGTTITYATAFNAKYVYDNKLGPGAIIKIVRSGDVIPHIISIVKQAKAPKMPDVSYKWNDSNVDIILDDDEDNQYGDDVIVNQLVFFFKKIKTKYIDDGFVRKMVAAGYDTIVKIIAAKKSDITDIDGIGDKLVDKVYTSIHISLASSPLELFMSGSNIFGRGLGSRKIREILKKYPDIVVKKYTQAQLYDMIMSVDGFSDITTNKFVQNLDEFKKFYNDVRKVFPNLISANYDDSDDSDNSDDEQKKGPKFTDQKIVFTGFRDDDLEKYIEKHGGKLTSAVSKNTNLVVYVKTDPPSAKITKAQELGIKTVTLQEFRNMIN